MILTLDISSTAIGYAFWLKKGLIKSGVIQPIRKGQDYSRLIEMGRNLNTLICFCTKIILGNSQSEFLDVWVEEPFFIPGKSRDTPIKMMHGIVLWLLWALYQENFSLNYVGISTWRKGLLPSKCSKEEKKTIVMKKMGEKFGVTIKDDNHADALGILKWRLEQEYGKYWVFFCG